MTVSKKKYWLLLCGLICVLLAVVISLSFGPDGWDAGAVRLFRGSEENDSFLIRELRLPRVLMAGSIGATLSVSGLIFQAILHNPLAEPYILGISGGAAAGVVLGLLLDVSLLWGDIFAFAGGMMSLIVLLLLGGKRGGTGLLLSGVMINAFCGAAVLFLVSLLQSHRMGSVLYWYLGDLGSCGREQSMLWTMIFLFGCLVLCCFGHFLNILLLGEETARTLGLEAEKVTVFLLIFVSCLVCLAVAAAGPLGFVGLVVPQILRHFFPYDHRILLPACMMGGSFFLLFCDTLSRTLPEQGELPAGVLTALVGAPVFIMLLRSKS